MNKNILENNYRIDNLIYLYINSLCHNNNRNFTCVSNKQISNELLIDEDLIEYTINLLYKRNYINIKYENKTRYLIIK